MQKELMVRCLDFDDNFMSVHVYLVEVDVADGEPLADEDDDGPAEPVHAALVQAADAGDLTQVLSARAPEKSLISEERDSGLVVVVLVSSKDYLLAFSRNCVEFGLPLFFRFVGFFKTHDSSLFHHKPLEIQLAVLAIYLQWLPATETRPIGIGPAV